MPRSCQDRTLADGQCRASTCRRVRDMSSSLRALKHTKRQAPPTPGACMPARRGPRTNLMGWAPPPHRDETAGRQSGGGGRHTSHTCAVALRSTPTRRGRLAASPGPRSDGRRRWPTRAASGDAAMQRGDAATLRAPGAYMRIYCNDWPLLRGCHSSLTIPTCPYTRCATL